VLYKADSLKNRFKKIVQEKYISHWKKTKIIE
jgi:hypothetical protein